MSASEAPDKQGHDPVRRRLIFGGMGVLGTVALGGIVTQVVIPAIESWGSALYREKQRDDLSAEVNPSWLFPGNITFQKCIRLRTSPAIPGSIYGRQLNNTIPWEIVRTINGVDITGSNSFEVNWPVVVKGSSLRLRGENQSAWAKVELETTQTFPFSLRGLKKRFAYMHLGKATEDCIEVQPFNQMPDYFFLGEDNSGNLVGPYGLPIDRSRIGKVTPK